MWILVHLLPLVLIPQFTTIGNEITPNNPLIGQLFVWFSIPLYVIVPCIFHTIERIGRTGENPFEGTSNDVPISTIARGIEIDLRQNLGESSKKNPKTIPY